MAHFAQCKLQDDGTYIVERVNYGRDEDNEEELTARAPEGVFYFRTSYGTRAGLHYSKNEFNDFNVDRDAEGNYDRSKAFRKNYAGPGYIYDPVRDAFYAPKPYDSWVLNETTCIYESPLGSKPQETLEEMAENKHYVWNEEGQSWDLEQR
jgi:hypothetical protein